MVTLLYHRRNWTLFSSMLLQSYEMTCNLKEELLKDKISKTIETILYI